MLILEATPGWMRDEQAKERARVSLPLATDAVIIEIGIFLQGDRDALKAMARSEHR
jgi:hypothetical protein